jgi:hypothetical protein
MSICVVRKVLKLARIVKLTGFCLTRLITYQSGQHPDKMPGMSFFISQMDQMVVRIDILSSAIM